MDGGKFPWNHKTIVTKQILKGIAGYANPGETLFIMGASGSGKTSLLNQMSDRIRKTRQSTLKGDFMINGVTPLNMETFSKIGSYVMQDDTLYSTFTPKEALTFAARLKLHQLDIKMQDQRVDSLLKELGLNENVQKTQIGSMYHKTISGGERKRTSIGVELIADPLLILLDEPTSGLDSFSAVKIVKLLRKLAKSYQKTIISTIHQPSSEAFHLFDRLMLMMDGYIVYHGLPKDICSNLSQIGYKCPQFSNPADYLMKVIQVEYPKQQEDEDRVQKLVQHYQQSQKADLFNIPQNPCSLKNIGKYHHSRGIFQQIIKYFLKSLYIFENHKIFLKARPKYLLLWAQSCQIGNLVKINDYVFFKSLFPIKLMNFRSHHPIF